MHLVVDLGNTRVKLAIFDTKGNITHYEVTAKRFTQKKIASLIDKHQIGAAILSNTSDVNNETKYLLNSVPIFVHLDRATLLPIENLYDSPNTLGLDRIAAAVACHKRYPGEACLYIDMGTCITMNFLNEQHQFVGGNISPGIRIRLKGMHRFTANLPLVDIQWPEHFFGKDTVSAMQNGAVKGAVREIDTFIKECQDIFGQINVILTGGDAYLFEKYAKIKIFVSPYLVLEGLNEILKHNVEKN